jgi:L-lysine exporter family protein LysE/ArgO
MNVGLDLAAGFFTSLALIVAIGSQNAFVLRQGIRREHVLPLVLFCGVSDALLIVAGVAGAGALVQNNPSVLALTRYGGAAFLATYGMIAARRAWLGGQAQTNAKAGDKPVPLHLALAACFGFTFLNPHVYLDTVVLLGSVASQRPEAGRWVFAAGACTASFAWFAALGFGARLLAPWFERPIAWRVLDSLIALVMLLLAASLLI